MVSVIQRVGSQGGGGGKCDTEGWILRMVSVIQRGGSRVGRDGVVSVIYRGVDPGNGKCDTEGWIPRMVSVIQRGGSRERGWLV